MSNRFKKYEISSKSEFKAEIVSFDQKEAIVRKQKFLDNYNLWLSTRKELDKISVRIVGMGQMGDNVYDAIIKRITDKKIIAEIQFPNNLRAMCEFWKVRTNGEGYPRTKEMILEPHKDEVGRLARQVAEKIITEQHKGKECEFDIDPLTNELRRVD